MEPLIDPLNDRQNNIFLPPPHKPLSKELMFQSQQKDLPDWKMIRDHLLKEGRIYKQDFIKLIQETNKIIIQEPNLIYLDDPINIIGDIHGQFYDLINILEIQGDPSQNNKYLFLGDYVDRGSFSIEVIILLYSIKINFPQQVYLLRGNHECRQMTSFFNFREECLYKYDQDIYELIMDSFDKLPLASVVNGKFFVLHGGLSPDLQTLEDLQKIERFQEPPKNGIFCDLIWSDPIDNDQGVCDQIYRQNDVRGCSYLYGNEAACYFLETNKLVSIIRAHEAQVEGYKMHNWNGINDFPVIITIFSAPNYCDVYNNKGAIIKFENDILNIQQINYNSHPYLLPNFLDIFTWSIPFVSEKVTECMLQLIKKRGDEDIDSNDENQNETEQEQQYFQQILEKANLKFNKLVEELDVEKQDQKQLKGLNIKLKFITKMLKLNTILRQNNEQIIQLKGLCPDNKIPKRLLEQYEQSIKNVQQKFNLAKIADISNEKMPSLLTIK